MPIFLIRSRTYRRVGLFGSTPSFVSASESVRDDDAASASRSRVYGLFPMSCPLRPGRAFAAPYGVTNRLSDSHARIPVRTRNGPFLRGGRKGAGQNFGSGACDWTSSAASSSVSTDGGEPISGCWAVSFMQATAIRPTRAAAIA